MLSDQELEELIRMYIGRKGTYIGSQETGPGDPGGSAVPLTGIQAKYNIDGNYGANPLFDSSGRFAGFGIGEQNGKPVTPGMYNKHAMPNLYSTPGMPDLYGKPGVPNLYGKGQGKPSYGGMPGSSGIPGVPGGYVVQIAVVPYTAGKGSYKGGGK